MACIKLGNIGSRLGSPGVWAIERALTYSHLITCGLYSAFEDGTHGCADALVP